MTEIDYGRLDAIEAALGGRVALAQAFAAGDTPGQRGVGGVLKGGGPRISIAAYDAPAAIRARADYAAGSSDADLVIANALATGLHVELSEGSFTFGHQTPALTGNLALTGAGPERTILKPVAGFTDANLLNFTFAGNTPNVMLAELELDLGNAPSIDGAYLNNINKLLLFNVKSRRGRFPIWLGYISAGKVSHTWHMDFQSAGIYVAPPNPATAANPTGQQPNVEFDTVHGEATSVSNGVAADSLIWVDCFTAGLSFENIWAIKSISALTGTWAAGLHLDGPEAPSGVLGHFALMNAVNTDGIDGPGIKLNNVRQVQYTNCFLGTRSAGSGGSDAGLHLFGTCQDIYSGGGNWISGSGIAIDAAATVNGLISGFDAFPQTVTGGAISAPSGVTLSNIVIGPNRYATAAFPDAATATRILLGAPSSTSRAPISPPKVLVSAANQFERIEEFNPSANVSWWRDITDTGSGWRVLDNGQRVVFALINGGGAQIGNQTGTTNSPITIKKITAQSTSYAGNATLAAGARDKVSGADITITNANMATNDSIVVNASIDLPQGVTLKASVVDATHIRVWVENNGTASANVGACNIRTTVIQYANA